MKEICVTALVSTWNDPQRPFRAEIIVDGHAVEKSYHSTRQSAFVWAEQMKEQKNEELRINTK